MASQAEAINTSDQLQLRRQLADRGQLFARPQTAATDQELYLILDLAFKLKIHAISL